MRNTILILAALLVNLVMFAQTPSGISYQAVIRDGLGNLLRDSSMSMRISIIHGAESGTVVFSETHEITTNANGLATIVIGSGETVSGSMELIVWSEGPFFLQVEVDIEGGTNYLITNTSQILSVPYAFYAETAGELDGGYTEYQDLADVLAMGNTANAPIKYVSDPHDPQDAINKHYLEYILSSIGFAPFNFAGAVSDTDHNIYKVVKIGNQYWMAENLRTTRLNDGAEISLVTGNTDWSLLDSPGYCWYGNLASNSQIAGICGALYNWYTIDSRKLCPSGWHVPNESDFIELTDFLEGESVAGGKLKENGTKNWNLPNTGATNISGFTAIPAGLREFDGVFVGIGNGALFWASKNVDADNGSILLLSFNSTMFGHDIHDKNAGLSVRCIKD